MTSTSQTDTTPKPLQKSLDEARENQVKKVQTTMDLITRIANSKKESPEWQSILRTITHQQIAANDYRMAYGTGYPYLSVLDIDTIREGSLSIGLLLNQIGDLRAQITTKCHFIDPDESRYYWNKVRVSAGNSKTRILEALKDLDSFGLIHTIDQLQTDESVSLLLDDFVSQFKHRTRSSEDEDC